MTKEIHMLFVQEAEKIISMKTMKKDAFAKSIGYNTINALNNALKITVKTFVQYKYLLKFCEVYNYQMDYFLDHNKYTENQKIKEYQFAINIENIVNNDQITSTKKFEFTKKQIIQQQLTIIKRNQDLLISMVENFNILLTQLNADLLILECAYNNQSNNQLSLSNQNLKKP